MKLNLFAASQSKQIPSQFKPLVNTEGGQRGDVALFTEYQQNKISPLSSEHSNSTGRHPPKNTTLVR